MTALTWPHAKAFWSICPLAPSGITLGAALLVLGSIPGHPTSLSGPGGVLLVLVEDWLGISVMVGSLLILGLWAAWGYLLLNRFPPDAPNPFARQSLRWKHVVIAALLLSGTWGGAFLAGGIITGDLPRAVVLGFTACVTSFLVALLLLYGALRHSIAGEPRHSDIS